MDRELSPEIDAAGTTRNALPDLDLLPSRRAGRDAIRAALLEGRGPVVLTGEPGVGKTALCRSLEAEFSDENRWVGIAITPSTDVQGFYALICHGLGLGPGSLDRTELSDFLAECSLDGGRWILAIDEAHNLGDELLEETRVLSNRLGDPQGFAAVILIGQTRFAQRLSRRSASGLTSRIAAHVHLRSLDADEVGRMLREFDPSHDWPVSLIERIHLMSAGRPARVMALASKIVPTSSASTSPPTPKRIEQSSSPRRDRPQTATKPASPIHSDPLVGPSRPPIRVEDGLIEVGWQAESDAEDEAVTPNQIEHDHQLERLAEESGEGEQPIHDHYAALQAWQEWATNQGRHTAIQATKEAQESEESVGVAEGEKSTPLAATPNLWADDEQGFAPFGRLFSRLRQENEAE